MTPPGGDRPRIALLTLEGAASAEAALRFAERNAARLALVGVSPPLRAWRATSRALRRGGPGLLPYLLCQFVLPSLSPRRPRLSDLCRARRVPWVSLARGEAALREAMRARGVELIACLHLDRVLSAETLAAAPLGGVNLHPSLLPLHRGPIPAFHALADGGPFGVSAHAMVARVDAGGVWARREVAVPPGLSAAAAARLLHGAGVGALEEAIARIASGEAPPPVPEPLPYRGWPTGRERRAAAARSGARLLGPGDWRAALLGAPAGGWRRRGTGETPA